MFEYVLPVAAAQNKPDDKKPPPPGGDPNKKPDDKGAKVVHTQMIGEKPGDDLGYDPKKIKVEDIPD